MFKDYKNKNYLKYPISHNYIMYSSTETAFAMRYITIHSLKHNFARSQSMNQKIEKFIINT
jgi:hypothetical protein